MNEAILKGQLWNLATTKAKQNEGRAGVVIGEIIAAFRALRERVKYAEDFGMIFGIMKTSDCPEGRLGADVRDGSDLKRLEDGVADLICAEARVRELEEAIWEWAEMDCHKTHQNTEWLCDCSACAGLRDLSSSAKVQGGD